MEIDFEFVQDGEIIGCSFDSTISVRWKNERHTEELEIFWYINKDDEKIYITVDDSGTYSFETKSLEELKQEIKNEGHLIVE